MKKASIILSVILICVLSAVFGGVAYAEVAMPEAGVLPEGVTLAGESLGGLTEEEAKEVIVERANALLGRTITLQLADATYDLSMEDLGVQWENPEAVNILNAAVMQGNVIARYKKMKDVEHNPVEVGLQLAFDQEGLKQRVEEYVAASSTEVQEAGLVKTADGFSVIEGKNSVTFDAAEVTDALSAYVVDSEEIEPLVYDARQIVTEPNHKTEDYSGFAGDLLGSYTTFYKSSEQNRSHNIRLAAGKISGHVYLPGEQFSILALINPVTAEAGYLKAGTYEMGQVVEDYGGGICQMATTIYDAALRAEMDITFRKNHSMVAAYVPYAWDAMIYAQAGSDFTFVNNTEYPIYIEVGIKEGNANNKTKYQGDSSITVSIFGTETRPANRKIEFRSETLDLSWADPIYEVIVDPNLPPRATEEIVAAHPKVVAKCWKDVYVDGELQETILINESRYTPGTGKMSIGTDITFDAWPVPGEDGWPKIYQSINYTSSLAEAAAAKKKQEDAAALAEAEKRKAEEAAAQAAAQTAQPAAPTPAPAAPDPAAAAPAPAAAAPAPATPAPTPAPAAPAQ